MPFDRELDQWRVREALRRGWIGQPEAELCMAEPGSGLELLRARGTLTGEQLAELDAASQATDDTARFTAGELIEQRYRVHTRLEGDGGPVYVCTDVQSGKACALKTLGDEAAPRLQDQLEHAALQWIGLGDHTHVVLAYGLQKGARQPYVLMEAVEGASLAESLRAGGLSWQQAACHGWQIANGLEYAWQVDGLLHRDLKPANVLVSREGVAKIKDFGLQAACAGQAGTASYRAPELWAEGTEPDVRSEIYSFGAMLFELVTGRLPFVAEPDALGGLHQTQPAPDPRQQEPRLPEPMARLILRCLEKRPKDRPENFATIRRVLEPFAGPQRQALSFASSRVGGLVNQSGTYLHMGRQPDGERAARNAVQLDARSVKARIALANALAARGAYSQALGHLEEAYRLSPTEAGPIVNSTLYAVRSGDLNRGQRWLQLALRTLPPRELESLTATMIDLGRVSEAIAICEQIVDAEPAAIVAWNSLSIARRRSGELEQALICADRTVQLNPRYAKGWSNRATILVQMGQFAEALESAEQSLLLDAATAGAYAAKAAALGRMGRGGEGRACLMAGLALLPGNPLLARALEQFAQPA